ncbi:DNA polymerase III subunit beta [Acutalibacter caecimuris]|uniref:DNA polymerase III subunit beta n=1 Tax=Acutalibacter caecimuris TaxID=3093657 RepID=UPI002AC8E4BE|nr:DNA polymerase III subunit beta [Acutalibacter sp. M00118]
MKFTVNRAEMTDAVSNIQRAVSTKTSIPALEGILIHAGDNRLELSAYDLELGISTVVPANVQEPGSTILSAKMFSDIVHRLPADTVDLAVDEKEAARIESGNSVYDIIGIPAVEFPELPKLADSVNIKLTADILKSIVRQTVYAVGENETKPIHQGCLFHIEGGLLDVVAVDGYRLAKRTEPIDFEGELSFVVPGKTLNEITKLLKDPEQEVEIQAGQRHIIFKIANYTVISSLLEGEFLNYKATIPASSKTTVTMRVRDAVESVERVSVPITDRLKSPVRCVFEENEVKLSCITPNGRARDQFAVSMEGEEVEIGFNNRYLLDALKNTESDEVRVGLSGPLSPMTIQPKDGDSFLFLVLPVRLKSE